MKLSGRIIQFAAREDARPTHRLAELHHCQSHYGGYRQKAANVRGGLTAAAARASAESGFTMVEIALCLAIIGFALVAIIGVLPTGLNVQRDNREETIIDQDAVVWMDAIRNGAQGCNDLTNYVTSITNYVWHYTWHTDTKLYDLDTSVGLTGSADRSPEVNVFTRTNWYRNGALQSGNQFLLNSGMHIIGALSRPRIEWDPASAPYTAFYFNYVVANARAISGSAVDKFPQTNPDILAGAFSYRMIPEIDAYVPFDTNSIQAPFQRIADPLNPPPTLERVTNQFDPALPDIGNRTNTEPPLPASWTLNQEQTYRQAYWNQVRVNRMVLGVVYTNSHDLRLTFRWPLRPNGDAGNSRHTFRLFTGGQVLRTYDNSPGVLPLPLYFVEPSMYGQR
jgi:type II secretory pathway pseudopilin PulG